MFLWTALAHAACPSTPLPALMACMTDRDPELSACTSERQLYAASFTLSKGRAKAVTVEGPDEETAACIASRLHHWTFPTDIGGPVEWSFLTFDPTTTSVVRVAQEGPPPALFIDAAMPIRIIDKDGSAIDPDHIQPGHYRILAVFGAQQVTPVGELTIAQGEHWLVRCTERMRFCKLKQIPR